LRKVLLVQGHNEIGLAFFGTIAERFITWVGRDLLRLMRLNQFPFFPQEVDDPADQVRPNIPAGEDMLILVKNVLVEQPCEMAMLDPVFEQARAGVRRLVALFQAGNAGNEHRSIDNASWAAAS